MKSILGLVDTSAVAGALGRLISHVLGDSYQAYFLTYNNAPALLSRELLLNNDLCVLDLFRTYEAGRRAEGIAVAERLITRGIRCLIIAPGGSWMPASRMIWEPSSCDTLPARIASVLDLDPPSVSELAPLNKRFARYLPIPEQHR